MKNALFGPVRTVSALSRILGLLLVVAVGAGTAVQAGTTTASKSAVTPQDDKTKPDCGGGGMCGYNFTEMNVSLNLTDRPVGYAPPIGPPVYVRLTYNHREDGQPHDKDGRPLPFTFFNVSRKWTLNWLSYIEDDPAHPEAGVSRYVAGGGHIDYPSTDYDAKTQSFAREKRDASILVRVTANAYTRFLSDGGYEFYEKPDGATMSPRRVFLTQIQDPAGNAVTLNYETVSPTDKRLRLKSLQDATGRFTSFFYENPDPLLITKITDPFGRYATITYLNRRLSTITDVLKLISSFTYNYPPDPDFVDSMTTHYGTTTFAYGDSTNGCNDPSDDLQRWLEAKDPLGHKERLEFCQSRDVVQKITPPITTNNGSVDIVGPPPGIIVPNNAFMFGRNTFYWDKHAYNEACATGTCDYGKARIKHWTHIAPRVRMTGDSVESIKYPRENRIWFNYPGQPTTGEGAGDAGTLDKPNNIARFLDDKGTQQQWTHIDYNDDGNVTSITDPRGRQTLFVYDPNPINRMDVQTISQKNTESSSVVIAEFRNYFKHRPRTYIDAAAQPWLYDYDDVTGQLTTVTNPLGDTTTYKYNDLGYLRQVLINDVLQASFTYDPYGRVETYTDETYKDPEGWTVTYTYDDMDRLTSETYPDGTSRIYTWDEPGRPLDLHTITDRQGRVTTYTHDEVRNLREIKDPLGNTTFLDYYENGKLKSLTDPKGNVTTWDIDIQSRITAKHYPDSSPPPVTYTYENTTSRLKTITDALGQIKQYGYDPDDRLTNITYPNAVNLTPEVEFVHDPYFPRISSITNGVRTTEYHYYPPGRLGALQPQFELFERGATLHEILYEYDQLGRLQFRFVDGSQEIYTYDPLGRVAAHINDLGTFNITYLGNTNQVTGLHSATVGTNWAYDSNSNDRRLKSITNSGVARSYQYTKPLDSPVSPPENPVTKPPPETLVTSITPEGLVTAITETARGVLLRKWSYRYDGADRLRTAQGTGGWNYGYDYDNADNLTTIRLPAGMPRNLTFNDLNQVDTFNGVHFVYDRNGNLIEDDQRKYFWDAENRLLRISYTGSSRTTDFAYDGLGRRAAMATSNGVSQSVTRYLWCGETLCQAHDEKDVVTRRYFAEGEHITKAGAFLYYARDHLGSVRDLLVTQNGSRVASFDYDPYGSATQPQPPPQVSSDIRYAGMFYHQDSGLYLTHYRAYDPRTGRWLSRDPLGEGAGANLYRYVADTPVNAVDRSGLYSSAITPVNNAIGYQPVHQTAIDRALGFLPARDREILKYEQVYADQEQAPAAQYQHAMRSEHQSVAEAKALANEYVRRKLRNARELECVGLHEEALEELGLAIHTLQDSTSPSHTGFQPWPPPGRRTRLGHVNMEAQYPGDDSPLFKITQQAYGYFSGRIPIPDDFFP
jgi:RHS repeat-associated protein